MVVIESHLDTLIVHYQHDRRADYVANESNNKEYRPVEIDSVRFCTPIRRLLPAVLRRGIHLFRFHEIRDSHWREMQQT